MARSSGRLAEVAVAGAVAGAAMPLRSVAALGVLDLAVLMLRASAIMLLLSPVVLLVLLAFA